MTVEERRIAFAYGSVQTAYRALEYAIGMLDARKDLKETVRKACDSVEIAKDKLWEFVHDATEHGDSPEKNSMPTLPPVLDPCCGSRMFWFDPNDRRALFVDCRKMENKKIWQSSDGKPARYCTIKPDVLADFRHLPFPDATFWHVVFDPPHLVSVGDNAWMSAKYGRLPKIWQTLIHDGFHECWRVLKPNGTLIFKWSEIQIPVREIIDCIGIQPLYGHKSGQSSNTCWMAFIKERR